MFAFLVFTFTGFSSAFASDWPNEPRTIIIKPDNEEVSFVYSAPYGCTDCIGDITITLSKPRPGSDGIKVKGILDISYGQIELNIPGVIDGRPLKESFTVNNRVEGIAFQRYIGTQLEKVRTVATVRINFEHQKENLTKSTAGSLKNLVRALANILCRLDDWFDRQKRCSFKEVAMDQISILERNIKNTRWLLNNLFNPEASKRLKIELDSLFGRNGHEGYFKLCQDTASVLHRLDILEITIGILIIAGLIAVSLYLLMVLIRVAIFIRSNIFSANNKR